MAALTLLLNLLLIAGGILTLYGLYFFVIAFFGLKKPKAAPAMPPQTRFAVLVAARNEEAVIGQLVDSLHAQNYPKDMYTVFVAPNNCTDDTRAVALRHGATVFEVKGTIRGKGDVLRQMCDFLLKDGGYDAFCVFDADNIVHPDFLQRMNDARVSGVKVAQGFRDSKNPADTAVSTCYSVCYWMLNRFYNGGRQALRLSSLVGGSGFMMTLEMLKQLDGWKTTTMTEDYEITAQCVLLGEKVHYVADAVFYDEQPLTFLQSWRQRRRWSTGSVQGMEIYLSELVRTAVTKRSWVRMDMALTFMTPMTQFVSLLIGAASAVLGAWQIYKLQLMPLTQLLLLAAVALITVFVVITLFAAFVIKINRNKGLRGTFKGIAYFAWFLLSWLPIGIISIFNKKKTWDVISHRRVSSVTDVIEK